MATRLMITLPPHLQTALRDDAERSGIAMSAVACMAIADYLERRGKSKPKDPLHVVENKPVETQAQRERRLSRIRTISTDNLTPAEQLKRFWDNRNEETKAALRRGWPIPTYEGNPRVWDEYEGAWAVPVDEAALDAEWEEYQRQQKETTS